MTLTENERAIIRAQGKALALLVMGLRKVGGPSLIQFAGEAGDLRVGNPGGARGGWSGPTPGRRPRGVGLDLPGRGRHAARVRACGSQLKDRRSPVGAMMVGERGSPAGVSIRWPA